MSEEERPRVEILVGGSWTQVLEEFSELRCRWKRARKRSGLLELTGWEGPLLLHPDALQAACDPVDREHCEDDLELAWPELEDADIDQAIEEINAEERRRRCEERPGQVRYILRRGWGQAH